MLFFYDKTDFFLSKWENNVGMKLQPHIAQTIFYSLLFAIGGAPTIAMWIISFQTNDPNLFMVAFMGLTVIIACVILPVILLQNAYLLFKRNDLNLEDKIKPLLRFYFIVNVICLISWILFIFR